MKTTLSENNILTSHGFKSVNILPHLKNNAAKNVNIFGYKRNACTAKLLDYLGYGDFYKAVGYTEAPAPAIEQRDVLLNPFPLLAYQKSTKTITEIVSGKMVMHQHVTSTMSMVIT